MSRSRSADIQPGGLTCAGVAIHRPVSYRADPQPYWQLPRTPVAETVLDLVAAARTHDDAYAWLSRAIANGAVTTAMVSASLTERKKFPGRAWLTEALTDVSDGVHFPLERRWKRDVERAHGFPAASRQVRRKGADGVRFLDNLYEPWGICVELDGLTFHTPESAARDRRRDNETIIEMDAKTLRYGFPEVANRPCEQAEQFARALTRQGWQADTFKACRPTCRIGTLVKRIPPS
jgi:hypothetical protein